LDVQIKNSTDSEGELNGNRPGLHRHSAIEPTPVSFNTKLEVIFEPCRPHQSKLDRSLSG
jgi:hypothetical protein